MKFSSEGCVSASISQLSSNAVALQLYVEGLKDKLWSKSSFLHRISRPHKTTSYSSRDFLLNSSRSLSSAHRRSLSSAHRRSLSSARRSFQLKRISLSWKDSAWAVSSWKKVGALFSICWGVILRGNLEHLLTFRRVWCALLIFNFYVHT